MDHSDVVGRRRQVQADISSCVASPNNYNPLLGERCGYRVFTSVNNSALEDIAIFDFGRETTPERAHAANNVGRADGDTLTRTVDHDGPALRLLVVDGLGIFGRLAACPYYEILRVNVELYPICYLVLGAEVRPVAGIGLIQN